MIVDTSLHCLTLDLESIMAQASYNGYSHEALYRKIATEFLQERLGMYADPVWVKLFIHYLNRFEEAVDKKNHLFKKSSV